eukprot:tig00020952_g16492.t1
MGDALGLGGGVTSGPGRAAPARAGARRAARGGPAVVSLQVQVALRRRGRRRDGRRAGARLRLHRRSWSVGTSVAPGRGEADSAALARLWASGRLRASCGSRRAGVGGGGAVGGRGPDGGFASGKGRAGLARAGAGRVVFGGPTPTSIGALVLRP